MTTSSTAIFVRSPRRNSCTKAAKSLYYGLDALSNNLIMVDRKKLKRKTPMV